MVDDTGSLAQRVPSLAEAARTLSEFVGPIATTLSGAEVARDIHNGNYSGAAFAATDTALSYALAYAGPIGVALDGAFITAGGTAAATRGAAGLGCIVGSAF